MTAGYHRPQDVEPRFGRRSVAAMVVAAAIVAVLVVHWATSPGPGARVRLLPAPASRPGSWAWTAACSLTPDGPGGCGASGPDLGTAQLDGDAWNLGGGRATAGSLRMSVSAPGALRMTGDFPATPPCTQPTCLAPSANTWVRGYPSVSYGLSLCHATASPPQSSKLHLPMQVDALPHDLVGTTTYAARAQQVTYDVAYDMWLNPSATALPCRTNGTLEVMVWTDYDQRALLPPSMDVGSATVPYAVDGAAHPGTNAWSIYVSNVFQAGRTVPWGGTVWLVLDQADLVSSGTVSVDLSGVFSAVGTLLEHNYGWTDFAQDYWLDTVPFGLEFGPPDGGLFSTGPSRFSLDLSAYCLDVGTTVSRAGC